MAKVTINGNVYTDGDNDGGANERFLGNDGHRANFFPLLQDLVTVAGATGVNTTAAAVSAKQAADSAAAASNLVLGVATALPNIKPSLNLDFANSQKIDPRITFTRASTKTYFDSLGILRTAAINQATIDFDPVTGICLGLGIWAQATNVALWNRNLTNAAWTKVNCTAALNQVGIDNTANSASLLTASAANATCLQPIILASSQRYHSAFIKRIAGSGNVFMTMNNGATWTNITSQLSSTLFNRIELPTSVLTDPIIGFKIETSGDAIAVDYIQNETGLFATPPILTGATSATRSAEKAVISGAFFTRFYNQSEGAIVVNASTVSFSNNMGICGIGDPTLAPAAANNMYLMFNTSAAGKPSLIMTAAGSTQAALVPSVGSVAVATPVYSVASYQLNNSLMTFSGLSPVSDTSCLIPAVTEISIGSLVSCWNTAGFHLNGYVSSLAYYPKALSSTELQALTS